MDKGEHPEQRLLAHAVKAMEPLGLQFRILRPEARDGDHRADAMIGLRFGGRRLRYLAEVKRGLRPATLGAVIHQLRAYGGIPLLVTDHVTPPLADALRAQGVEFIDAAGNAFLNQPPLLIFVKGQRPADEGVALERGRAFQPTGLQVLFALVARPEFVARPYREIAAAAGVAHGTVGWVMAELPGLGYLAKVGGRRRLINGELIGGELAAARLTRHLRPGTATFYTQAIDPRMILKLRLKADAEGNVDFRRRFWNFRGEQLHLTPTLLVYADLLAIGDARCLETAQLLRGQLLARLV